MQFFKKKYMAEPKIRFFEKDHVYIDEDTGIRLDSATEFISMFFEKFDKEKWSRYVAKKDNISVQEVLDKWEKKKKWSCEFGTSVHNYAEDLIKNKKPREPPTELHKKYFDAIDLFMKKEPYKFIYAEKIVGSPKYRIAGTIDAVSKKNNSIYLIDWKTNKKIETCSYNDKRCLSPIHYLPDCNFTKYSLQLSLYRFILEVVYGWKVEGQKLVHLKPNGSYFIHDVDYLKDEIVMMLSHAGRL